MALTTRREAVHLDGLLERSQRRQQEVFKAARSVARLVEQRDVDGEFAAAIKGMFVAVAEQSRDTALLCDTLLPHIVDDD